MQKTRRLMFIGAAGVAVLCAATGVAATGMDTSDSDEPITGEALTSASAAALAFTGGGTVTDSEIGDEESKYEIEVTMPNGDEIDVQLDADFKVVGSKTETGGEQDDDDGAENDDK